MEGVQGYSNFHYWQLKSGVNVCSLQISIHPQVNEQILRQRIHHLLKGYEIHQITVQMEKNMNGTHRQQQHEIFYQHEQHSSTDSFHVNIGA